MLKRKPTYHVPLERSPQSLEIMKRVFSKVNCLACGICCKAEGSEHGIGVIPEDPNREALYRLAKSHPSARIEGRRKKGFQIMTPELCAFLEENTDGNLCSVYDVRPVICANFPFILHEVKALLKNGTVKEKPALVLTSACPPIKEIDEAGVSYVAFDDIATSIDGRNAWRLEMPFLDHCFYNVLLCVDRDILFEENFVANKGKIVFPIL